MASYPPPPPGTPPGAPGQPQYQQPQYQQPPYQQPPYAPPPQKKSNVLMWVLIGVGGLVALIILAVVGIGLFVVHKAKQAGIDPDLLKRNPTMAAAKMMVAANPDLQLVSVDDNRQEMTLLDKKSGKKYTASFSDIKNGRFNLKENGKETFSVNSSGNGQVEMKSADGTLKIGGDAKIPTWMPEYPGAHPEGAFTAQGKDGTAGTYTFKTKDTPEQVVKFYQDQVVSSGMKVVNNMTSQNNGTSSSVLTIADEANKRNATIIIGSENSETTVAVTYQAQ